ncbi:hypothetical protein GH714_011681 [Hevea brasiliensis]|uniref:RRM domain-containing protein n=1 Tax=Hevea brasiliensis TaxID=3981 RepID=A0A6A6K7U5_HEVBR|nr:hypothetical protein GH714_011681 [Hevea brasiliensis]
MNGTGREIMIGTGKTGTGIGHDLLQRVDLNADPNHVHAPVPVLRGQIPGTNPAFSGMFPNMFPLGPQFGALPVMPVQAMTQQATRHARRVYVGGLSPTANEQSVATFFSHVMAAIGGNTAGPGDAVVNVYINHERSLLFGDEGAPVKVRRPSDYNPSLAATLGPSQPNPNLNLAVVGLTSGSAGGLEGPDRIFVGGLPYITLQKLKSESCWNPLGLFEACQPGANQPKPEQDNVLLHAQQQIALQRLMLQPAPTKVVCLTQVVTADELKDDEEYENILEDMRMEGGKFGTLVNVVVPRPKADGEASSGVGKVFLEYADIEGATRARAGMNGRKFGGNQVVAVFYPENKFYQGEYDG